MEQTMIVGASSEPYGASEPDVRIDCFWNSMWFHIAKFTCTTKSV